MLSQTAELNEERENITIYVEKKTHVPSFNMPKDHYHMFYEIFYLKRGSCSYLVNGCVCHLSAGDAMVIAPMDHHSTQYDGLKAAERIIVFCSRDQLQGPVFDAHPELQNMLDHSARLELSESAQDEVEQLLNRMLKENNMPGQYSDVLLHLELAQYLLTLKRGEVAAFQDFVSIGRNDNAVDEAIRYLTKNFNQPITLEKVARHVSLSPIYFSSKFKKATGLTFKEKLNEIRLQQAIQQLLTTEDSITKIAMDNGFGSGNYFKDVFRRSLGVSPRTYRQEFNTTQLPSRRKSHT